MKTSISMSSKRVAAALALGALFFIAASVVVELDRIYLGLGNSWGATRLFSAAREGGIQTWYSTVLLLFCSVLLAIISAAVKGAGGRGYLYWAGLAVVFVYLSADEGAEIHERFVPLGRAMLDVVGLEASGALARAWVVPGAVGVLLFALVYLRFFMRLPSKTRLLFFAAGAVFLGGAVGVEVLTGFYLNSYDGAQSGALLQSAIRLMLPNVEELLEMLGGVVLAYALMSYMSDSVEEVKLRVR